MLGVKNNAMATSIMSLETYPLLGFSLRLLIVVWMLRKLSGTVAKTASRFVFYLLWEASRSRSIPWINIPGNRFGEKHSKEVLSHCSGPK